MLVAALPVLVTALVLDDEPSPGSSVEQAYEAARDDPDGRVVSLASEDGTLSAEAVVQPDGVGFLSAATLARAAGERDVSAVGRVRRR